jgi:DUF4097 and DUF4098 domain-containing protein YvlB
MKLTTSFMLAALVASPLSFDSSPAAAQQGDQVTVPFSDPARPGSVRISSLNGTITVRGANRRDVLIETRGDAQDRSNRRNDRAGGLRKLSATPGFEAVEENNQMVISSNANDDAELVVLVPTRTNLKVSGVNGGPVTVEGVDGDIEVSNTNDDIVITGVSGSVVANSVNGDVKVSLTRVNAQKPMAFTSFNGDVDVTLPASLKATLKLRSDMGDVYTDFDLQVKTETTTSQTPRRNGQFRIEVNRSMTGALNGGGPEVELRTFQGDVYLRKGAQ